MSETLKPVGSPAETPAKESGNLPDVVFNDLPETKHVFWTPLFAANFFFTKFVKVRIEFGS